MLPNRISGNNEEILMEGELVIILKKIPTIKVQDLCC